MEQSCSFNFRTLVCRQGEDYNPTKKQSLKGVRMQKTILMILIVLLWAFSSATAAPLKVGDKVPDFKLKDALGKEWSLAAKEWKKKVIMFNAQPTDKYKTNLAISEAVTKDTGIDKVNKYVGAAIFSSPSALAKAPLRNAQRKYKKVFLIDNDDIVLKLWGLKAGVSTMIVLDKDRVCRYIHPGKVPTEEIPELLNLIKILQER
jgi:predicted transcriptional regulator